MIDWQEKTLVRNYLAQLPVSESALVQLGSGELGLKSIDARGQNAFIVRFRTIAQSIWTMVPENEWVGFLIPLSWDGDYLLNGMSATTSTVFQLDGAGDYDTVTKRRDTITVGVRRAVMSRTISHLIGRQYWVEGTHHQMLHVPQHHRSKLISACCASINCASSIKSEHGYFQMNNTNENGLISAVANWMIELNDLNVRSTFERRTGRTIVSMALEKIRQTEASELSVADLCSLVGVQKSRLHEAFIETCGVSPGQYLYKRRLNSVREKLLASSDKTHSVKGIAIQYGFFSSGQFARAYRSLFGELPGVTLGQQINVDPI